MKKTLLISFFALLSHLLAAQIPTSGLAAYYSFNDSTTNDHFSDNHGANNGATFTADRFGNANSAVYFNGGSYIDCGDSVEFDLTYQTGYTISCWTKHNTFPGSLQAIVTKWNQSSLVEQYGLWATGNDYFTALGQLANNGYTISTNFLLNEWNHVVLTYDTTSGNIILYFNGTEINNTFIGSFPGSNATNNLSIGAQVSNTNGSTPSLSRYFTGYIDDVRIYSRAIDSAEVRALYYDVNPAFSVGNASASNNSPICIDEAATIDVSNSNSDLHYYLMSGNTVVDGPTTGNGSTISFTTDPLTANSNFYLHATYNDAARDFDNDALKFDGVNDYLSLSIDSTFRYDTAYSVEAWVKVPLPNNTNRWPAIFSITNNDSTDIEIYVQNSTNDLVVVHNRNKISGFGGHGYSDAPNNEWFHLAVTYDGSTARVYYNGVLQTLVQAVNPLQPAKRSANAFASIGFINSNAFMWNSYFNGSMDNLRVWNHARTQTQIEENMHDCLIGNETGLVGLYKFDDGNLSTVAADYSNTGADADLVNMDSSTAWIPSAAAQCGRNLTPTITIQVEDCDSLGVATTLTADLMTAYPNPTSGIIQIRGVEKVVSVDVIDMMGKTVQIERSTTIDITALNNGIYLLKVNTALGTEILRVVKK